VRIRELGIAGAWEFTPVVRRDDRGSFLEFYRFDAFADAVGHPLDLRQGNVSVSRAGVIRGIHYALVPPGQAKYVSAAHGAFLDYVIDLRVGSPTFGNWESVRLDDETRSSVYLAEGLGHAVVALTDDAVLNYLVSSVYDPARELVVDPFDPEIGLEFPPEARRDLLSPRDVEAPSLRDALAAGQLPTMDDVAQIERS